MRLRRISTVSDGIRDRTHAVKVKVVFLSPAQYLDSVQPDFWANSSTIRTLNPSPLLHFLSLTEQPNPPGFRNLRCHVLHQQSVVIISSAAESCQARVTSLVWQHGRSCNFLDPKLPQALDLSIMQASGRCPLFAAWSINMINI